MLFKLTATTEQGKKARAWIKYPTFKGISSKADFINDAITRVLPEGDFIKEVAFEAWTGAHEDVFIKVSGNKISGQVAIGNYKLVDLN